MANDVDIIIRNPHGAVAGRISRSPDGSVIAEVLDEASRWIVDLAAERYGAPARPRPRPSCSSPSAGTAGGSGPQASTSG